MICTGCCNTLDHIVTYVFRQLTVKGKKARKVVEQQQGAQLIRLMEIRPELLQQMLSCILNIVMFEECRNQYSMSRPLLGLILLNEDYFGQLRQSIVHSQPVDKQSLMAQWFDNLMDGIERNVTAKNRDRYTIPNCAIFSSHKKCKNSLFKHISDLRKIYHSSGEMSTNR
jgi:exportin-7